MSFKRPGDLERHLATSKIHGPAQGPSCPLGGCKFSKKKFTRLDNFKAHLVKQHRISMEEVGRYIRRWKERGKP